MVDPCFIFHDDSFEEMVTFSTIAIQKPFADIQTFLIVQFFELLFDPSSTGFTQGNVVVHNFVRSTMTTLQWMCCIT
jgi:hypothetical protein